MESIAWRENLKREVFSALRAAKGGTVTVQTTGKKRGRWTILRRISLLKVDKSADLITQCQKRGKRGVG